MVTITMTAANPANLIISNKAIIASLEPESAYARFLRFGLERENFSRIVCHAERREGADVCGHCYSLSSSSRVLASFRSGVSKPSVNQL
jgi:hypothetical protein